MKALGPEYAILLFSVTGVTMVIMKQGSFHRRIQSFAYLKISSAALMKLMPTVANEEALQEEEDQILSVSDLRP